MKKSGNDKNAVKRIGANIRRPTPGLKSIPNAFTAYELDKSKRGITLCSDVFNRAAFIMEVATDSADPSLIISINLLIPYAENNGIVKHKKFVIFLPLRKKSKYLPGNTLTYKK